MAKINKTKTNRLAGSGSPYLLQHASNPVDWHPWSDEVFATAAAKDKPVFLSIGYSTCHWCHVMERESFADEEVAALMNENFVCVKVDREERPDVDGLYMTVCQLLTGSGGWPLTIIMTPDRKPFFAGTYLPKDERYGRPGMLQLIARIKDLWSSERDTVEASAGEIADGIKVFLAPDRAVAPGSDVFQRTCQLLSEQFDAVHGGFGSAPKFPVFSNLLYLLRYWHRTGEERALAMVSQTLHAMHRGGIYDQIGYGLHRYSTDSRWFAPHFEKMLYDQALAVLTCVEAFCATGDGSFREMAVRTIEYVTRDLLHPEGGYYSAEDADSEGEEGRFYTWTARELDEILDPEEAAAARAVYGISDDGNFSSEAGQPTGRNILHTRSGPEDLPGGLGMDVDEYYSTLDRIRAKLMGARHRRVRPLRDDKVMTDWNGLMIAALAKAARVFEDQSYKEAAERAFQFITRGWSGGNEGDGTLPHVHYEDGETIPAFLDDHAFLAWGALELYQITHQPDHLRAALKSADEMVEFYQDEENGGFFLTRSGGGSTDLRLKPSFDGPMPSGNAVAAMSLLRLGRLTGRRDLEEVAHRTFEAFGADMSANPAGYTHMISALDMARNGTEEVIIAGDPESSDAKRFLSILNGTYLPTVVVGVLDPGSADPSLRELIPYASQMKTVDGKAAAYVCRDFACQAPTTDPQEMLRALTEGQVNRL